MFKRPDPPRHVNPRYRAYGRARIEIAQRARTRQEWDALWKRPQHGFPFEWGQPWKQCIEYRVEDFAAEVGFFIDILGLPVSAFNASYAQFTSPAGEFYFAVTPAGPGQAATPPEALRLQFMVADIFWTYEELLQRGIMFEALPQPLSAGSSQWIAMFRSPHGLAIELWGFAEPLPPAAPEELEEMEPYTQPELEQPAPVYAHADPPLPPRNGAPAYAEEDEGELFDEEEDDDLLSDDEDEDGLFDDEEDDFEEDDEEAGAVGLPRYEQSRNRPEVPARPVNPAPTPRPQPAMSPPQQRQAPPAPSPSGPNRPGNQAGERPYAVMPAAPRLTPEPPPNFTGSRPTPPNATQAAAQQAAAQPAPKQPPRTPTRPAAGTQKPPANRPKNNPTSTPAASVQPSRPAPPPPRPAPKPTTPRQPAPQADDFEEDDDFAGGHYRRIPLNGEGEP